MLSLLSQDKFELLSLLGTLEPSDNSGGCKKMSNFKVSLLTPNSHLLAGVVVDKLIAASLVKVLFSYDKQFMLIF